jgi:endoglucanase
MAVALAFSRPAWAELRPPDMNADEAAGRLRVTHVGLVAPEVIGVTLRAGRLEHGSQQPYQRQDRDEIRREGHQRWLFRNGTWIGSLVGKDEVVFMPTDKYIGDRLDADWVARPGSFQLQSPDDARYAASVQPRTVWRKTKPCDIGRVGPHHAWEFDCPTESVVYLEFPVPLSNTKKYELSFPGSELAPVAFPLDYVRSRSEAVHVSHVGFHPHDPVKRAFLSCWRGTGGPQTYTAGLRFVVAHAEDGRPVARGLTRLSKAAADRTEDAYQRNYSGTDVFEMDFSQVQESGRYVVAVEGVGCSYTFEISAEVWRDAFITSARGFYHQRSGIALGPPFTDFVRPQSFHPADGLVVRASSCSLLNSGNGLNYAGTDKDNFGNLVQGRTDEVVPDAWGGYMDAGDWDRRIQHLVVSRYLLELAEVFPAVFRELKLNIPPHESGLPDVVTEALFNLDCYRRMQTADGGIRGGIESSEHPREGEGSWQESLEVLAYAPDVWCSHWYAGVAARAARVLREVRPELSQLYRDSALRAMEFAERHWKDLGTPKAKDGGVIDERNMAAAELFLLTADDRWHRLFLETTVFHDPHAILFEWSKHNQRDNAWVYARTAHPGVDASVQTNCRNAIITEADARAAVCERTGFRWTKYEWQPPAWGAFSRPDGVSLARAHLLTGEEKYLRSLVLACQHGLGANPLNLCYTTGVGRKSPLHPLHIDSAVTRQLPPPGLTVFGPVGYDQGKDEWGQKLVDPFLFPEFSQWPTLEAYWDIFWYPPMTEFTVQSPMAENAYVWGYLTAAARR